MVVVGETIAEEEEEEEGIVNAIPTDLEGPASVKTRGNDFTVFSQYSFPW